MLFRDSDNVPLLNRFYQVIEMENGRWGGDVSKGFLCDNFDGALDGAVWISDGRWSATSGVLQQLCDTFSHTSVAATLNQSAPEAILFDFRLKFLSGERCLFGFGADGADIQNAGTSGYVLVADKSSHCVSLIKKDRDGETVLYTNNAVYFTYGQFYLLRVVWRKDAGEVLVFRHNTLILRANVSEAPLDVNAQYVVFATAGSSVAIDNVRSYIARADAVTLSVGPASSDDLRAQALSGVPACKIKSIVLDAAGYFSPLVEQYVKVDYTPPEPVTICEVPRRAVAASGIMEFSWNASSDPHSGIASYYYAQMSPEGLGRLRWICLGLSTSCSFKLPLWESVFSGIAVRAVNGAGLAAESVSAAGTSGTIRSDDFLCGDLRAKVEVFDLAGRLLRTTDVRRTGELPLDGLPSGVYLLRVLSGGKVPVVYKILKQ